MYRHPVGNARVVTGAAGEVRPPGAWPSVALLDEKG